MEPLILRSHKPAASRDWEDSLTDREPLPTKVATDGSGATRATLTQITKVDRETTDDR
jgi:hypothetical protein